MILRHFFDDRLAQSSYLVGCPGAGEALVIDPTRDTDLYLEAAAREGLRIVGVAETHIHADFASGSLELAESAGATLFLSGAGGADWQYETEQLDVRNFSDVERLTDGSVLSAGKVRLTAWHTPGHTPEHLTFLLTDLLTDGAASIEPLGVFTGDLVFVGDVGRPDLLEKAAHQAGTMQASARDLYHSLQRLRKLPNGLLLFPGHGAGSACGKSLGGVPVTTLGYERRTNWAFQATGEAAFVQEVLQGQPEPPPYFARMKQINKTLTAPVVARLVPRLGGRHLDKRVESGEWVAVDVRPAALFGAGHWPGAINIPRGKSFLTWAGTVLAYDRPLLLFAENARQAQAAASDLRLIGMDAVIGWAGPEALAGGTVAALPQTDLADLAALQEAGAVVVDVRGSSEWQEGHIPGARHIPLGQIAARAGELPHDVPLVVHCQGGTRSPVAASLLLRHGFGRVSNLPAGVRGYQQSGRCVDLGE